MGGDTSSGDSSSEDDGNAEWRAAIHSVVATTTATANREASVPNHVDEEADNYQPKKLKHYQIKALKVLDSLVEKSIEISKDTNHVTHEEPEMQEGGIRLFKQAPPGIVFDYVDELQGPRKKPRILPGEPIDEKSKQFKLQLKSVIVNGSDIIDAAKIACQKALTRLEAKDVAAKAAAKREEERVAELKRIRGERWLPSMAKYMHNIKPQKR